MGGQRSEGCVPRQRQWNRARLLPLGQRALPSGHSQPLPEQKKLEETLKQLANGSVTRLLSWSPFCLKTLCPAQVIAPSSDPDLCFWVLRGISLSAITLSVLRVTGGTSLLSFNF